MNGKASAPAGIGSLLRTVQALFPSHPVPYENGKICGFRFRSCLCLHRTGMGISMNALITTSGKLLKTEDGRYWSKIIYGYSFYRNYLNVFDTITVFSQVRKASDDEVKGCLLVSGDRLNVVELEYTHGFLDYLKKKKKIERQIRDKIDLCDCAVIRPPDQISYDIMKLMHRKNKPVAIEVTTDVWSYLSSGNSRSPIRSLLRFRWTYEQRKMCATAEGAAYVSNYLRTAYPSQHALKPANEKCFDAVFTDAGLTDEYYQYQVAQYDAPIQDVRLVHVAASLGNDAKGYRELMEAAAMLRKDFRSVRITVIGDGDFSENVRETIKSLGISDLIEKTGKISDRTELFGVLRASDVFVFPSYSEGMPRTLLEAMVNGCVCVTTDLPGCMEVLSADAVVPIHDSLALYEKLKAFLTDTDRMNREKIRNYEKSKEYSARSVDQKRSEFYKRLYDLAAGSPKSGNR